MQQNSLSLMSVSDGVYILIEAGSRGNEKLKRNNRALEEVKEKALILLVSPTAWKIT